jgi:hypothetical protein
MLLIYDSDAVSTSLFWLTFEYRRKHDQVRGVRLWLRRSVLEAVRDGNCETSTEVLNGQRGKKGRDRGIANDKGLSCYFHDFGFRYSICHLETLVRSPKIMTFRRLATFQCF